MPAEQFQRANQTVTWDNYVLSYEDMANIRLQCSQQDFVTKLLEKQTAKHSNDIKYHAMARNKIWQLRTYCQGETVNAKFESEELGSTMIAGSEIQTVPERRSCRTETVKQNNNGIVTAKFTEQCIEESAVKIRPVQIGDLVRSNEVGSHPVVTQEFLYKANRCRWFFESGASRGNGDLAPTQGIMCQVRPAVWRIIDKF